MYIVQGMTRTKKPKIPPLKVYLDKYDLSVKEFAKLSGIPERVVASYAYTDAVPMKYMHLIIKATKGEVNANHYFGG